MASPIQPLKILLSPRIQVSAKNLIVSPSGVKSKFDYTFKQSPKKSSQKTEVKIKVTSCSPIKKGKKRILHLSSSPIKNAILKEGLQSYKELNILGRGSFGTVVRGSYKGQEVAVKVAKTKSSMNEINALHLVHENIIKTLDVIIKDELHSMIIMEYLPFAYHLQSLIDNEDFNLDDIVIVDYSLDMANALVYCHMKNVLHLDVKPSNILVVDGRCKLCDFGNSRILGNATHIYEGTIQYTAPELLIGKLGSPASDVYSLGVVMWQLRARENPYSMLDCRDQIIYNVVKHELRPCSTCGSDVDDDDFARLYRSCWQTMEAKRPSMEVVQCTLVDLQQRQLQFL